MGSATGIRNIETRRVVNSVPKAYCTWRFTIASSPSASSFSNTSILNGQWFGLPRAMMTATVGGRLKMRDLVGRSHHFIVGITKSAPERIPVGQRVVMVFRRV
jgi:hypothetical protein